MSAVHTATRVSFLERERRYGTSARPRKNLSL